MTKLIASPISSRYFKQSFERCGIANAFSQEAFEMLFDYFDETRIQRGENINLSVYQIASGFSEWDAQTIREEHDLAADADVEAYLASNNALIGKTAEGKIVFKGF